MKETISLFITNLEQLNCMHRGSYICWSAQSTRYLETIFSVFEEYRIIYSCSVCWNHRRGMVCYDEGLIKWKHPLGAKRHKNTCKKEKDWIWHYLPLAAYTQPRVDLRLGSVWVTLPKYRFRILMQTSFIPRNHLEIFLGSAIANLSGERDNQRTFEKLLFST